MSQWQLIADQRTKKHKCQGHIWDFAAIYCTKTTTAHCCSGLSIS